MDVSIFKLCRAACPHCFCAHVYYTRSDGLILSKLPLGYCGQTPFVRLGRSLCRALGRTINRRHHSSLIVSQPTERLVRVPAAGAMPLGRSLRLCCRRLSRGVSEWTRASRLMYSRPNRLIRFSSVLRRAQLLSRSTCELPSRIPLLQLRAPKRYPISKKEKQDEHKDEGRKD
jgi:hypothetical protein